MMSERPAADEPFFREWKSRRAGEKRSLGRAKRLAKILGISNVAVPVLSVVGSKGKATTALYASAALGALGFKVGTLTSPPIRSNRERIRINGVAISPNSYTELSSELARVVGRLPARDYDDGYLAPTGLFTLVGTAYMLREGCNVLVLEAGMGGKSDEISLFSPTVVAVTAIFEEHIGIIGDTVEEVALDKISIITDNTRLVISLPQSLGVERVLRRECQMRSSPLRLFDAESSCRIDSSLLPAGFSRFNACLGVNSAYCLADSVGRSFPRVSSLETILETVRTPGRLSVHTDEENRTWVTDAAISESGILTALRWFEAHFGEYDNLLICIPDDKDPATIQRALQGRPYTPVRLSSQHLTFDNAKWPIPLVDIEALDQVPLGSKILALGTWSFIGAILTMLQVDTEELFTLRA